eukprot:986323-Prorocentrum_minimum.AAC.1
MLGLYAYAIFYASIPIYTESGRSASRGLRLGHVPHDAAGGEEPPSVVRPHFVNFDHFVLPLNFDHSVLPLWEGEDLPLPEEEEVPADAVAPVLGTCGGRGDALASTL